MRDDTYAFDVVLGAMTGQSHLDRELDIHGAVNRRDAIASSIAFQCPGIKQLVIRNEGNASLNGIH